MPQVLYDACPRIVRRNTPAWPVYTIRICSRPSISDAATTLRVTVTADFLTLKAHRSSYLCNGNNSVQFERTVVCQSVFLYWNLMLIFYYTH